MANQIVILALFFCSLSAHAQWSLIRTIDTESIITSHSVDFENHLYIGTSNGDIIRLDTVGNELSRWSPAGNSPVSSIQASNRLKIFSFCRDIQEIHLIERFTAKTTSYSLDQLESDFITLCSFGTDNSLWVLNTAFNELKKINLSNNQIQFSNPLSKDLNQAFQMESYKNQLIIGDHQSGIYIFDWFGNFIQILDYQNVIDFQISNEQLILLQNEDVIEINSSKMEETKRLKAPRGGFQKVGKIGKSYYFISEDQIFFYSLED